MCALDDRDGHHSGRADRCSCRGRSGWGLRSQLAVCLFIVVWGTSLCIGTWGQSLDTLPWMPVGLTYAALPLGSLCTALFVLERMVFGSMARRPLVAFGEPGADFEGAA